MIDQYLRRHGELLIAALALTGGAGVVLVWGTFVAGKLEGKPVTTVEDLVDVACPQCGYSLIGLRTLQCPECGTAFTIDDLIRRQNYTHVRTIKPPPIIAMPAAPETPDALRQA